MTATASTNELINDYGDYVQKVVRFYTDDPATADDFFQNACLLVIKKWPTIIGREIDNLDGYIKQMIRNAVRLAFRRGENSLMAHRSRVRGYESLEGIIEEDENVQHDWMLQQDANVELQLHADELYDSISECLDFFTRKVLQQIANPDREIWRMAEEDFFSRQQKRKAGKLQMRVNEVYIKDKYIARFLGVSSATISRARMRIREAAELCIM